MARVLVTGSTDGLGRLAAIALLDAGHEFVLHARNHARAVEVGDLASRASAVAVGDLASAEETREVAAQFNALGRMDAVIHNAGVYAEPRRIATPEGHARVLAVNVLAPYILSAEIIRPDRLVYLSSGMHRGADATLDDLDWTARRWSGMQAYSESKLLVVALAGALARRWPEVRANAVDPGWVPTRMGGPGAPDDLELGYATQVWLATSEDPAADATGGYWHHGRQEEPRAGAADPAFQAALLAALSRLTGIELP